MKINKIGAAILGGIAGILIGACLVSWCHGGGQRGGSMMGGRDGDKRGMMANIDQHFIEEMIPHHDGAIAMAQLALTKSKRPEMLQLANDIIKAQQKEIDDMKKWYEAWFGKDVPANSDGSMGGMMGHGGKGMQMDSMTGDLATLASASDFDLEFIAQMIPHHEMAVMMARMLASTSERPEMLTLASNIIASQSAEIKLMQGWQTAWVR